MKNKGIYYSIGCILLTVFFLLNGCKSTQKIGTVASRGAKEKTEFFNSLKGQAIQFNTLTARLNVNLDLPGKNLSSRVDLKMIKDSAFQLSVVPLLGFEIFRIEIGKEEIKILDRLNKKYVVENYEQMRSESPVAFNFYNLQALFTNHIFIPGEKDFSPSEYSRFKLIQEGPTAEIRITDNMNIIYTFTADGEEKVLNTQIMDSTGSYVLNWKYNDFQLIDKQTFPTSMNVQVTENGNPKSGMQFNYSRIQVNEPVRMDFDIPAKYERVYLKDILKNLTKNL